MVKNLPSNAGNTGDTGSIPGLGRSPGIGNGNPLQFSCLENSVNREVRQAAVHEVPKSWTWLKRLSTHKLQKHSQLSEGVGGSRPTDAKCFEETKHQLDSSCYQEAGCSLGHLSEFSSLSITCKK